MNLTSRLPETDGQMEALFSQYLKEKRFLANFSERTLKSYREIFDRWHKYVHSFPTGDNLKEFVIKMREAGLSPVTCNISIRAFNAFLTWLAEKELIDPRLRLKKVPEEKKVFRVLPDEKLKAIVNWKPKGGRNRNEQRIYAVVSTLIDTGLRITECLSIKLACVDFDNLLITVQGKGKKERVVPMSLDLRKVLHQYVHKHRYTKFESPYLFCTSSGRMMTYRNTYRDLEAVFEKVGIDKADIDGFFHMFRRKFARSYVKNGGNILYLQQAMGHSHLSMTKHYVQVDDVDLKEMHLKTSLLSRLR